MKRDKPLLAFLNHLSTLSEAPRPPNRGGVSDVSRSPCLFGVCDDNETIPYWSGDTTLGGKVGWGAAQTDNEGQTLADFSLVAVGGWCLEATAAGGFQHEPTEAKAEEKGEERPSHQMWLKKTPKNQQK